MIRFWAIAVFFVSCTALADGREPPSFPSRHLTLANGLDVYLEYDDTSPIVAISVTYAAGGRDDPDRRPGLAHLTEHVTYQGTRDLGEDAVIAAIERTGAREWNGQTSDDETEYYMRGPRDAVSTLLWIEAQRMAYVLHHANASTVAHQREVVSREWYEHVGDHAGSAQASILASALFPAGHPYARMAATPAEIARLSLDDVRWFYQTYYRPARARLAIVGDVPLDEAERLVRLLFDGIVDRGPPFRRADSTPIVNRIDRYVSLRAPTPAPTLMLAWPTPAYFEPLDAELDVLASVLCSNESSALGRALVHRTRLALGVHCVQASRALASSFFVEVLLADGSDVGRVVTTIDSVFRALAENPLDERDVDAPRSEVVDFVIESSHDPLYRARMAAGFTVSTLASVDRYSAAADVARYRGVSAVSMRAAVDHLNATGRAIVLTTPDPAAPDEGIVVERFEVPR